MMIDVLGLDLGFVLDQIVSCERSIEEIEFSFIQQLSTILRSTTFSVCVLRLKLLYPSNTFHSDHIILRHFFNHILNAQELFSIILNAQELFLNFFVILN